MDDGEIVRLYWDRDERAITASAEKYGTYCTAIARNILRNIEDAEECVNDTYLNAWNTIPPHKPNILSTFLGKITRNLSINKYKHNHTEKRGGGQVPVVLDELRDIVSDSASVEQSIEQNELVAAIDIFLAGLSEEKRKIFVCRYWYFDSVSDIAERFGMTENNVSVTLSRMRTKLHNYLLKRGFEL